MTALEEQNLIKQKSVHLEYIVKTTFNGLFIVLALLAGVHQAKGQLPVISSFSQNGVLVCTNLPPGSVASVQWASSLSGPWNNNWAGLDAVTVASNGTISMSVPMFYRVCVVAQTTNTTTSDGMVLIPAGVFTMGDTLDGDSDAIPTNVTVSAFYMDTNLVSFSQWQTVFAYATTSSHGYGFYRGSGKAANHPVQMIDWYDAVKWCNARSQQAGLTPVYYTDAGMTQVYKYGEPGDELIYANWSANGYRLPTEAEWEKAARGGLSGQRFPWGNTISESQANYYGVLGFGGYDLGPYTDYNTNFDTGAYPYTSPVGSFAPNGYGLYDMAGNVTEWCWDWYDDNLSSVGSPYAGGTDPRGPASSPYDSRVLRGGCWSYFAYYTRCASRNNGDPGYMWVQDVNGFRCVRGH
jgi:formylglycine-generating enzyme required for sulfatase activity